MFQLKFVTPFLLLQCQEVQQLLHILSAAEALKHGALVLLQLLQRPQELGLLTLVCVLQQLPATQFLSSFKSKLKTLIFPEYFSVEQHCPSPSISLYNVCVSVCVCTWVWCVSVCGVCVYACISVRVHLAHSYA